MTWGPVSENRGPVSACTGPRFLFAVDSVSAGDSTAAAPARRPGKSPLSWVLPVANNGAHLLNDLRGRPAGAPSTGGAPGPCAGRGAGGIRSAVAWRRGLDWLRRRICCLRRLSFWVIRGCWRLQGQVLRLGFCWRRFVWRFLSQDCLHFETRLGLFRLGCWRSGFRLRRLPAYPGCGRRPAYRDGGRPAQGHRSGLVCRHGGRPLEGEDRTAAGQPRGIAVDAVG